MPVYAACPDLDSWERFLLGQVRPDEAETLEAHLAGCPDCGAKLGTLDAGDTLAEALRLRPGETADESSAAEVEAVETFVQRVEQARSACDDTRAEGGHSMPPAVREACDFLDPPQAPGELGRLGPYRVVQVLGEGGMGIVLKAEEPQPRRWVAIKVVRPERTTPGAVQRFLREAQALASVEHERIVPVFRVDEVRGVPFLVMPLLQGESLYQRLKREGNPPLPEVLRIGRETAEGLAAAHAEGLIHRDVKPSNLWLRAPDRRVVLIDFGLARLADNGEETNLTAAGSVVGTAGYMAPEQAAGQKIDARADLFSLGCVLYELATGERPFVGPDAIAILSALANRQPAPPKELKPEVPEALSALIMRLLAKPPDRRPQSAAEVVATMKAIEERSGDDGRIRKNSGGSMDDDKACDGPERSFQGAALVSRRFWLWMGATAAAAGAIAWMGLSALKDKSAAKNSSSAMPAQSALPPLSVLSIDVTHYERLNDDGGQDRGILGQDSFSPRLRDQVTIEARLSRPAYAYLLAFRPDGIVELCFPDEESPPVLTDRPRYPPISKADKRYGLREGTGLWVFAVVASDQPLPSYREFESRHKPDWSPRLAALAPTNAKPADWATIWWYNGRRMERLTSPRVAGGTRAKQEDAMGTSAEAVEGAARWLKRASKDATAAAIGFAVGPAR